MTARDWIQLALSAGIIVHAVLVWVYRRETDSGALQRLLTDFKAHVAQDHAHFEGVNEKLDGIADKTSDTNGQVQYIRGLLQNNRRKPS